MDAGDLFALFAAAVGAAWIARYIWRVWVKPSLPTLRDGSPYPPPMGPSPGDLPRTQADEPRKLSEASIPAFEAPDPFRADNLGKEWAGAGALDLFGRNWEPTRHDE